MQEMEQDDLSSSSRSSPSSSNDSNTSVLEYSSSLFPTSAWPYDGIYIIGNDIIAGSEGMGGGKMVIEREESSHQFWEAQMNPACNESAAEDSRIHSTALGMLMVPSLSARSESEHEEEEEEEEEEDGEGSYQEENTMPITSAKVSLQSAPASTPIISANNLVSKDPIVASTFISSLSAPSLSSLSASTLQMLVLGVPTTGAKSRVETQIKISIALIRSKDRSNPSLESITADGGLDYSIGKRTERIGTWSHIKLPSYLTLRQKNKKQTKKDPSPESTLYLEVALLSGSSPYQEIFICSGCQQREHKRSQRKKEARVRPVVESSPTVLNEEEEKRKVVIFNCAEFIEFGAGEALLPTRITCYCRHHKEKLGFAMSFTLKDCRGNIVSTGSTPPIMITDDHKTRTSLLPANDSASTSTKPATTKSKPARPSKAATRVKDEGADFKSSTSTDRPRRATVRSRATRGVTEDSEEEEEQVTMMSTLSRSKKPATAAAKPYDSESRPRKRQSGVHRSPSFAMTPLTMSKPGSPISRPVVDTQLPTIPSLSAIDSGPYAPRESVNEARRSLDAALGVPDLVMRDTPMYSASESTAPSPAASFDWTTAPGTPYSPVTSINIPLLHDNFSSFYHHDPLPSTVSPADLISPGASQQYYDPAIAAAASWGGFTSNRSQPLPLPPRISRLIPGEGPVQGGIEVTILGENFVRGLRVVFGDCEAMTTHFWSSNTLICILPPSSTPGPVVVGVKGTPLSVDDGLQLFTYKDDSDRSLLELALQVVGLKMTGRLEDAKNVAMRIVGNSTPSTSNSRHVSPTSDTAGYTHSMTAATASVYNDSTTTERNFESIVINFLSLLDLDPAQLPGSTPFAACLTPAISHANAQRHTILHLAVVLGFSRLVQFLLVRGIHVELADKNGYTALHFAALYGRIGITRLLLDAGAASYKRTRDGKTPLDLADADVEEVLLRCRSSLTRGRRGSFSTSVRGSSGRSTPASSYARSEASDWDQSSSDFDEDSDDDDNFSFHTSDEEGGEEDLERGLISRSNSVVSLHYLLHSDPPLDNRDLDFPDIQEPVSIDEKAALRHLDELHSSSSPAAPSSQQIIFAANKGVWSVIPKPLVEGAAWAKMKLPAGMGFAFPALGRMPRLVALPVSFTTKLWSNEKETLKDRDEMIVGGSNIEKSAPAMYSPLNLSPIPPTNLPSKAQVQAKLQRRVGYVPEEISDRVVASYLHSEKKRTSLRHDRMLFVFWIPALLLVLAWAVFQSFGAYIRPVLLSTVDSILPFRKS